MHIPNIFIIVLRSSQLFESLNTNNFSNNFKAYHFCSLNLLCQNIRFAFWKNVNLQLCRYIFQVLFSEFYMLDRRKNDNLSLSVIKPQFQATKEKMWIRNLKAFFWIFECWNKVAKQKLYTTTHLGSNIYSWYFVDRVFYFTFKIQRTQKYLKENGNWKNFVVYNILCTT